MLSKHRFAVRAWFGIVVAALSVGRLQAQLPESQARLLKDLQLLTSEACEGRGIGAKGIDIAADYIERQFAKAGLRPGAVDGSYSQRFTLTSDGKLGKDNTLVLTGPRGQTITLTAGRDFSTLLQGGSGEAEAALVFAGYGLTSTDPAYDDYAGLDVAGKIVVVLADTPRRGHPFADVFAAAGNAGTLHAKVETARKHKAAGLLVVNTRSRTITGDVMPKSILTMRDFAPWDLPTAQIARSLVDAMLSSSGETLGQIERKIDADLQSRSRPLAGWTCKLQTDMTYTRIPVRNIIGVLEGSGPLAKETVVIGAHYDHVGQFGSTRRFPGIVKGVSGPGSIGGVGMPLALINEPGLHHGADDNASGTSALMEIARRFGSQKDRMGRRLVFIAFTAEESGLLGSDYYCRNPVFPLADTVAMINMDQIGRLQDDKLLAGGLGSAKSFEALVDKLNAKHGFKLSKEFSGFAPSDNSSFYSRKIPAVWFFTGFHEQYHRPTDRWETLNVAGLDRVAALVGDVAQELTTVTARPEYQKTGGFDRSKTIWATAPSTGVVPNYDDKGAGLLIDDVFKDTAAAKAGVKKGDRILAVAGTKIANPYAFHMLSRTLSAGSKVDLLVERDGKEQTLTMELVAPSIGFADSLLGVTVNLADLKKGLEVLAVTAAGPAAKAGVQKGDRVTAISGQPIADRDTYFAMAKTLKAGEVVSVTVARGAMTLELKVTVAKKGM